MKQFRNYFELSSKPQAKSKNFKLHQEARNHHEIRTFRNKIESDSIKFEGIFSYCCKKSRCKSQLFCNITQEKSWTINLIWGSPRLNETL